MNIQTPVVFGKNERIPDFADHLLARGLFDQTELAETSSADSLDSGSTLRRLWKSTDLSSHEFANEVAAFFNLRKLTLMELADLRSLADRFTPRFLREASLFPFETEDGAFALAAGDPSDAQTLQAVEIVFGAPFELVTASFEDIATALGDKLDADDATAAGGRARKAEGADESVDNLRDLASGAPVVRAVNDLIEKAVELRASDIHIEPFRDGLKVRMRVDGLLRNAPAPAHVLPQALVSRVKILAGLNIAERRLPQDGAARLQAARTEIDVRVATMPTQHGESAVIRLLPRDRGLLDIPRLGLAPDDERKVRRAPQRSRARLNSRAMRRAAGFTLIEVVCVLAIIALIAALVLPAIPRATSRARLESYALEAAALLTADRNAAIRRRTEIATALDANARAIRSGAGAGRILLPRDVAFDALLAQTCNGRNAGATIDFFPSGRSCGGTIELRRGNVGYQVRVNWLTGGAEVVSLDAAAK